MELFLIHPNDSVAVDLASGHKYAVRAIGRGEAVVKYGFPIGIATADIRPGEHVHTHNLASALNDGEEYVYAPRYTVPEPVSPPMIRAYPRANGDIGIRNDVWIVPTVGCVNAAARELARRTGALCFTHPYGCSQLGGDHEVTQKILAGLVRHPNAGGVLVLGLGCENNNIKEFRAVLGPVDESRIRFLNSQDCEDELAEGERIIRELQDRSAKDVRVNVPLSELRIGLKCGGSDGLSGITANPMCGRLTDRLTAMGCTAVLTEVPEMFGAERLLMERCVSREVFDAAVGMIDSFKQYFIRNGQPVGENPSPGNKEGGITTLEEKSLGCVQKGGCAPVTAVLAHGDAARVPGLNLLDGPGNDMVAVTGLTAAGCHIILFTTGRGTPLGAPVPTVKIATNTALAVRKKKWIDFDAQTGTDSALYELLIAVAEGAPTANETAGARDIAVFKNGVTL